MSTISRILLAVTLMDKVLGDMEGNCSDSIYCYQYWSEPVTWPTAYEKCTTTGGYLISGLERAVGCYTN